MENNITNITRKEIFKVLFLGVDYYDGIPISKIKYYGDLNIPSFLRRLYDIDNMPSFDSRYTNAKDEIFCHTVANNDYPDDFILDDERFRLRTASDQDLLNFLAEIFHPEVRMENGWWPYILRLINEHLSPDGFELYPMTKISSRDVYGWRKKIKEEAYLPFSIRHARDIESKKLSFSLPRKLRESIICTIHSFNESFRTTTETGFNYDQWFSEASMDRIADFYEPRCFNEKGEFVKADNLEAFIKRGRPYCIMDVIEIFSMISNNAEFDKQINALFASIGNRYRLRDGLIVDDAFSSVLSNQNSNFEKGAKELLDEAATHFHNNDKQISVEKLWDALERIKTVLPGNKKQSSEALLDRMSHGDAKFRETFAAEIKALTEIGNNFRIRHHETDKVEISHSCDLDYFYHRCASFINLAIQYLA